MPVSAEPLEPEAVIIATASYVPRETSRQEVVVTDPPPPTSTEEQSYPHKRITLKGGWFSPDEDSSDDGTNFNVSWMNVYNPHFALEVEMGYIDAPGNDGNALTVDGWGIPLLVNGRGTLPLGKLDLYGGLGLGTVYVDVEAQGPVGSASDDGFLFAGDLFLGASVDVGKAYVLGLEVKKYLTGRTSAFDWELDGYALLLTLGFNL